MAQSNHANSEGTVQVKQQNISQKVQPQVPWPQVGCALSLLLQHSTDNQPTFVLDHSHCFVSNLIHPQPLLSDSWKVDVILYVLLLGRFTQSLFNLFKIYKWQAKQRNAQFECITKTEVYFKNDWRKKTISSIQSHDITKSCTDTTASSKHDLYRGADKSLARPGRKFLVLYILFIIIIEGILLLFTYITRLEPSDLSTPLLVIGWQLQVYIKCGAQFSFRIPYKSMAANDSENFELLDKTAYKYFSLDFVGPLLPKVRDDIPKHDNTTNENQTSI